MERIQVSARILSFPHACCCCGNGGATGTFKASSTRTTGKRVIKTDTRSWDFPLCDNCKRWINEQNSANAIHTSFIVLVVISGLLLVFGGMAIPSSGGYYSVVIAVVMGIIAVFVRKSWVERQASADKIKPNPDCSTNPVIYDGWQGSVHTFRFSNQNYCAAFEQANAKKLLG